MKTLKKEVFQEGEGYSIVKPIDNEELLKRVNEMITVNDQNEVPLVASSNTRPLC